MNRYVELKNLESKKGSSDAFDEIEFISEYKKSGSDTFIFNLEKMILDRAIAKSKGTDYDLEYMLSNEIILEIYNEIKQAQINEKDSYIKKFCSEFLQTIKDDVLEDGMLSNADLLCKNYSKSNPILFLQAINELFIKSYSDSKVLVFILSVLSKMKYKDIRPNGVTMVLSAMDIKDIEVKDYALKAIESWGSQNFRDNLKNIEVSCKWMQDYIDDILKDAEK